MSFGDVRSPSRTDCFGNAIQPATDPVRADGARIRWPTAGNADRRLQATRHGGIEQELIGRPRSLSGDVVRSIPGPARASSSTTSTFGRGLRTTDGNSWKDCFARTWSPPRHRSEWVSESAAARPLASPRVGRSVARWLARGRLCGRRPACHQNRSSSWQYAAPRSRRPSGSPATVNVAANRRHQRHGPGRPAMSASPGRRRSTSADKTTLAGSYVGAPDGGGAIHGPRSTLTSSGARFGPGDDELLCWRRMREHHGEGVFDSVGQPELPDRSVPDGADFVVAGNVYDVLGENIAVQPLDNNAGPISNVGGRGVRPRELKASDVSRRRIRRGAPHVIDERARWTCRRAPPPHRSRRQA